MLGFLKNRRPKEGDKAGEEVKFTGANEMTDVLAELNTSEKKHSSKGGFFGNKNDSIEFLAVKDAVRDVLAKTSVEFSSDMSANDLIMQDALESYGCLAMRCTKYLNKRGGKSKGGKARKEKVQMILDWALKDSEQIEYYRRENRVMDDEERANLSWSEIIHTAREALIEVEDITKYDTLGASVKQGEHAGRALNNGVFVPERRATYEDDANFAAGAFNTALTGKKIFKPGESINLTGRNVAMSRVAKLIGLGGMIEESQTVCVKDKNSNRTIKGNLMSYASGTDGNKIASAVRGESYKTDSLEEREKIAASKMTGTVRKELSSLQVLDYLCGQGDRHEGNIFFEQDDKGRLTHVHGIDNDNAFGDGVDLEAVNRSLDGNVPTKVKMVVDSRNNLTIPHMDKTLAMNIKNLTAEELRFALEDIIEDRYIAATIQRLKMLQEGIRKEESKSTGKFLDNDAAWDDKHDIFAQNGKMHKYLKFLKDNGKYKGDFETFSITNDLTLDQRMDAYSQNSYYARLIESMMGGNGVGQSGVDTLTWMFKFVKKK